MAHEAVDVLNPERLDAIYDGAPFAVTTTGLEAYRDATLDADRRDELTAPLAYTIVPAWSAVTEMLRDASLAVDQTRCVQGEERITLLRPIRVGDSLHTVGRLARIEQRGPHEVLILHLTTANGEGRVAAVQDVVCVIRGEDSRRLPSDSSRGSRRSRHEYSEHSAVQQAEVTLPHDIASRYAEASGDDSPIHTDRAFAMRAGFPSTVVQGMCLLAIALRSVDAHAVPVSLTARFRKPAFPGDTIRPRCWSSADREHFELTDHTGSVVLEGSIRGLLSAAG